MANEPDLREGATDADTNGYVTYLQQLLQAEGYYQGAIDGYFGPVTDAAVRQYQEAKGLTVDGWVGPITWGALTGESGGGDPGDQPIDVDWGKLGYLSSIINSNPSDKAAMTVALGRDPSEFEGEAIA